MNLRLRPATEVCTVSSYEPLVPSYTQTISTSVFQVIRLVQLLLALLLLVVAFVLWFWSNSFETGRLFGQWFDEKKRDPLEIIYKIGEILVFPIVVLRNWSLGVVEKCWGIKLPLISESQPPEKCSDLLKSETPDVSSSA